MSLMQMIQDHYGPATARSYDDIAFRFFWAYEDLLTSMAAEAVFGHRRSPDHARPLRRMLDLGIGTGNLTVKVIQQIARASRFTGSGPNGSTPSVPLEVHGLDGAPAMMAVAREKLNTVPGISLNLVEAKLENVGTWFEPGYFDLIVSSYAIHHLDDHGKSEVIRILHALLAPGGLLVVGDRMPPEHAGLQGDYLTVMSSKFGSLFSEHESAPKCSEIIASLEQQFDKDGDRPSSVDKHLEWFEQAGFKQVRSPYFSFGSGIVSGVREAIQEP